MDSFNYFLRILSRKDYSTHELLQKGKEKGFSPEEINHAIAELQSKDYQSDSRLVENLIISSQGKYGKSVIKRKCYEKGINLELFEEIWQTQTAEEETDDLADFKAKVMRKYKIDSFQDLDPKTKSKLVNYLSYRGFNPFETIGNWQKEDLNAY